MRFSSRARGVAESATLRLSNELARLRAEGADVIGFLEGEPDLPVPAPVLKATQDALRAGDTRYSRSAGLPELKAAIARKLKDENGVTADPQDVLVTNGAKQAVYELLQALCDPGDEVIVPAPYWVTFPEAVQLAGAKPAFVPPGPGMSLNVEAVNKAWSPRTRAVIVNSPNNPSGAVFGAEELGAVVELAASRDAVVISDEAYEGLVYDGAHVSPASLGEHGASAVVTVQTFSKSFGMTGYRVGCAAGPRELIAATARLHGHVTGNVCTFAQRGALAALGLGRAHRESWRAEHRKRRDLAFQLASKVFDVTKPTGGLFLFADARRHFGPGREDSAALASYLLREAGVAVVPGSACGLEGFLRISFSTSEAKLREGFARLEKAL